VDRRKFIKTTAASSGALFVSPSAEARDARATPLVELPASPQPSSAALPDLAPARWIWYPSARCLANTFILFRRPITLRGKPISAKGWIAADSRYRLEVNGRRIQCGPAPADPRWAEADPIDLTDTLTAGENVIGATVLFFGHGDGTWPIGKPGFLFWLEVTYDDGTRDLIVSNDAWQAHLCRAWPTGQYKRWFLRSLQEEFDARKYPHGWSTMSFSPDANWLAPMQLDGSPNQPALITKFTEYSQGIRTGPADSQLRPRSIPLLAETPVPVARLAEAAWIDWLRPADEYFDCRPPNAFQVAGPLSIGTTQAGQWTFTLGDSRAAAALTFELTEQVVGYPYFTIEAPAGTVVELLVQEGHAVGGAALLDTGRDSWTRFICREGVNEFECFDYESLRWLQLHIRGAAGPVSLRGVGVRRRMFPWHVAPTVKTNEPALQRLFDAAVNTLNNSAQDVVVDGMGRERQQYSGDCGHQLQAIRLAFGETRLPARFLTTYSQGMTSEGYFLDCWPAYDRLARIAQRQLDLFHLGPILDHGVQLAIDCWRHYLDTGGLDALREPYPRLLRMANYLAGLVGDDNLLPVENLGIPCVWMDYQAYGQSSGVAPEFTQRRKQCAFNLYVAGTFEHALAPLCRAMGDDEQAAALTAFARRLHAEVVRRFWSRERRMFVNNLPWLAEEQKSSLCDRSLATSVLFDQCPGGDTAAAVRTLVDCPREMGLSYPANAGWRLWALAKEGRTDVIVADLRKRWATMESVKQNNTIQEGWGAKPDSSSQWSHCAVAPLYIAYQGLAGIRPLAPGFTRVELRPQLADLGQLELVAQTVIGPLHFRAQGKLGERNVSIKLPPNCEGEIVLPEKERTDLAPLDAAAPKGCRRYKLKARQTTLNLKLV
jgi:hypothetical protein